MVEVSEAGAAEAGVDSKLYNAMNAWLYVWSVPTDLRSNVRSRSCSLDLLLFCL